MADNIFDFKSKIIPIKPEPELDPQGQMIADIIDSFVDGLIEEDGSINLDDLFQSMTSVFFVGYELGQRDAKEELVSQLQCEICQIDGADCDECD